MTDNELTPQYMLQNLLLEQAMTKPEIARITQMPTRDINTLLTSNKIKIKESEFQKLTKLYKRLKFYDEHFKYFFTKRKKLHHDSNKQ